MSVPEDQIIIDGLRLAESIRNLDERTALKIALALAGTDPALFSKISNLVKTQNLVPPSTLKLKPPNLPEVDPSTETKLNP